MSRDVIFLFDTVDKEDGFEVELWEGKLIFTILEDEVVMLDVGSLRRLRNRIEEALCENTVRDLANAREIITNLEQENREARALIMTMAEGKDNLRREIDHLERETKDDDPGHVTCNCGETFDIDDPNWDHHASECDQWMPDLS